MGYRIGIDARILSEKITGIGRYTHEILRRLVLSDHEWILFSHMPLIIGDWSASNVKIIHHKIPNRLGRMIWSQSALPYLANKEKIDVFWSPAHRLPIGLSHKTASVVTIHDLVWKHAGHTMRPLSKFLDSKFMPSAVKQADKIISVSNATANDLLNAFPETKEKINVIPLGFSIPTFTSRHQRAIEEPKDPYILFVGTMEPRKNLERLLQAYSRLPQNLQAAAKLVLVGGLGWGNLNLNLLIEKLGISQRVDIRGYVSEENLDNFYRNAMFLALPSLYEGFGLPILEALARGTPVLTSNCSSMPEVAGSAALYVDPHSIDSIAEGLSFMIKNKNLRSELSLRASDQASKFSWESASKQTLTVLLSALRSHGNERLIK